MPRRPAQPKAGATPRPAQLEAGAKRQPAQPEAGAKPRRTAGPKPLTTGETEQLQRLSERLVAARLASGFTQEELARRAGVSGRYLQKLEAGLLNPSYLKVVAIARALGRRGQTLIDIH